MQIGLLGATGPAGSALATRLASVGCQVTLGSREPSRAASVVERLVDGSPTIAAQIAGASNREAANAEMVVIATPWDVAAVVAAHHRDQLDGKVVISMANALIRVGGEFQPLVPPRGSVANHVQAEIPNARVVAAFQHIPAVALAAIEHPVESDVLIASDYPDAIGIVSDLVDRIPGCRPLDSGALSNATAIEAFTAVLLQLNVRYRTRAALRVTGIDGGS